MLPIYLSSPAFNLAALTSYTNFSFLQHLRYSAFFPEHANSLDSQLPSDPDYDLDELYDPNERSWKQGLAETFFFYSQNLPTVALLLPRAGLSLALLFAFSSPAPNFALVSAGSITKRDGTFFRQDGTLTDYARGVLVANAVWTAWKILVLLVSWYVVFQPPLVLVYSMGLIGSPSRIGLWLCSNQRLGGICGPRHGWEETQQEKTRSVYSEAASEYGAYRGSFYQPGEGSAEYGGDELPWEWRESTRMRVQDTFEFCLTIRKSRSDSSAGVLRWSTASGVPVVGRAYGQRSRRYRNRHHKRKSSAKGKEPLSSNEKAEFDGDQDEPFEGIERVLAAVGFPTTASPARRGVLSKDLFSVPASTSEAATSHHPVIEPLQFQQTQPTASTSMFTGLEAPKMAKRDSKDKIPGSSNGAGAPLLALPYPFSRPGAGQVSSKDSVPFPGTKNSKSSKSSGSRSGKSSKSGSSKTRSSCSSGSGSGSGTGSGSGGGSAEGEEEDEEDEEDEDDDDDEDDEDDEDVIDDSEEPSSGRASGSMSSLGHPIGSPSRYPFGMRRPTGAGHGRSMSGVSSGMSSGPAISGGSHVHSMSSSYGTGAADVSVITHSTGNAESTDSEFGSEGRERASLSQGSRGSSNGSPANVIPMPPRHPRPHGQGRARISTGDSSSSAAAAMAALSMHSAPIAFPTVRRGRRINSGRGVVVDPATLYGEGLGTDIEGQHEVHDDDDEEHDEEEEEEDMDEEGESHDRVGLLGVPSSPRTSLLGSRVSLANSASSGHGGESRLRPHSSFSGSSGSRHSSTQARSRSRTHSSHSSSIRERANSLGASMRSLMQGASASLTQLDLVMRGATGPAAGLGGLVSRPRSRVNSSMARLEEDVVYSPSATEMGERNRGSGASAEAVLRSLEGAEGYVSSAGTHSRSGSESVSGENHTFGRPILFMRPTAEQQQHIVEEADDEVLVERSTGTAGRGTPSGTAPVPIPIVTRSGEPVSHDPFSVSLSTASFYSAQSDRTASPTARPSGLQVRHSPSPPFSAGHSPERQGVDIPWNQRGSLAPSRWSTTAPQFLRGATMSNGSPPDISTAAGSFVTAPATIEGNTTATDSSGQRTVSNSWDGPTITVGPAFRSGGMVERPGEYMGAGGGAGRVM